MPHLNSIKCDNINGLKQADSINGAPQVNTSLTDLWQLATSQRNRERLKSVSGTGLSGLHTNNKFTLKSPCTPGYDSVRQRSGSTHFLRSPLQPPVCQTPYSLASKLLSGLLGEGSTLLGRRVSIGAKSNQSVDVASTLLSKLKALKKQSGQSGVQADPDSSPARLNGEDPKSLRLK